MKHIYQSERRQKIRYLAIKNMNHSLGNSSNWSLPISLDVPFNNNKPDIPLQRQVWFYGMVTIGILANIVVLVVVCCSRQLHYPRHIFFAAISMYNTFSMIQPIVEIVAVVGRDQIACQLYVLGSGINYSVFLLFLVLAALDRYLAIAHNEWYKKRVTNRGVVYLLSIAFILTCFVITSPFWTGYKSIKSCTVNLTHMQFVLIYDLLLGIICVTLHAMILIQSRKKLRQFPSQLNQAPNVLQFLHSSLQRSHADVGKYNSDFMCGRLLMSALAVCAENVFLYLFCYFR